MGGGGGKNGINRYIEHLACMASLITSSFPEQL
jgi:hypothetical protein